MRILIAHVSYEHRGGEDVVVETEARLLRDAGHEVSLLVMPSLEFRALPRREQISIAVMMGDHEHGRALIRDAVEMHHPDVVHFHNLYPLLGPGAIQEAAALGCATVQTLHNYRLSCIAGTHFRDGVCELCSPGRPGNGVVRGCYRGSRTHSLVVARGCSRQWRLLHEQGKPDVALCLTRFMRERLVDVGVPAERVLLKPNSVDDGQQPPWGDRSGAVFVGRLSPEKGALQLVRAWPVAAPDLGVIGDGPEAAEIRRCARSNVHAVGARDSRGVRAALRGARVCIVPSASYEGGLPLVALEALAESTPVVAFNFGAMREIVDVQGLVPPVSLGDYAGLTRVAVAVAAALQTEWETMSARAHDEFESRYSHQVNVSGLATAYELARTLSSSTGSVDGFLG